MIQREKIVIYMLYICERIYSQECIVESGSLLDVIGLIYYLKKEFFDIKKIVSQMIQIF